MIPLSQAALCLDCDNLFNIIELGGIAGGSCNCGSRAYIPLTRLVPSKTTTVIITPGRYNLVLGSPDTPRDCGTIEIPEIKMRPRVPRFFLTLSNLLAKISLLMKQIHLSEGR